MGRRLPNIAAVCALACACRAQPPLTDSTGERAVESYLESRGLRELLADRLEAQISSSVGGERVALAERLGQIYAEMLESSLSPQRRADIEARARRLLESVKDADPLDLRIRLLRASYGHAEKLAERWRIRLADSSARDEAASAMSALADEFAAIGVRANRIVDELQRQEELVREADSTLLTDRLAQARRQRSLAMHLAGWSRAYAAELRSQPALALEALVSFGWLLGAPVGKPADPTKAAEGMLRHEHVARSAVGCAVACSVRADWTGALAWLDLLERAPDVPQTVRDELPPRRMIVLAAADRWRQLADYVDARRNLRSALASRTEPTPLSAPEARLIAILALESKPGSPEAQRDARHLASSAVADLVTRAEIAQALDLATRYGEAAFGGSIWLTAHVEGLRVFEQAREAHRVAGEDLDSPTSRADVAALYRKAADALDRANTAPDAGRFASARGRTLLLLGFCRFAAAGPGVPRNNAATLASQAADALIEASGALPDRAQAAEALAGAIRALELAVDRLSDGAGRDPAAPEQIAALQRRRDGALRAFVENFPESPRVGLARVKLASSGGMDRERAIHELLKVDSASSAFEAAQRQASRLAYEALRASRSDRDWAALRFADLEEPLMFRDRRRAEEGDAAAGARALGAARRLLDAILSVSSPDADRAQRVFDVINVLAARSMADLASLDEELTYRRAQLALAHGDTRAAGSFVNALESAAAGRRAAGDPNAGAFARSAGKLLYRDAELKWRAARRSGQAEKEVARLARETVRAGGRALVGGADAATAQAPPSDAELLDVLAGVGEAALDLWRIEQDTSALALASRLHERALAVEPRDAGLLRRSAEIAEGLGEFPRALERWSTLSSGLAPGAPEWHEARFKVISLLARADTAKAKEAIEQHRVLYPDFGPEPWGARMRTVYERLFGGAGEAR